MERTYTAHVQIELDTKKLTKQINTAVGQLKKKLEKGVRVNLGGKAAATDVDKLKKQLDLVTRKLSTTARQTRKLSQRLRTLRQRTRQTTRSSKQFTGVLDEWWKRFGKVAIGFTLVYRAMNALENAIVKMSDTIRQSIELSGQLVSTQAKLAMWAVILSDGTMEYAEAFEQAAGNTMALAEASVTAISTLEELNVAMDEMAQAGIIVSKEMMKPFADLVDFTQMVALTTGSATRQIRQEFQALMQGQIRATNVLVRTALQFHILSQQDIQDLKDMSRQAEIFEKIVMKISEHWDDVKERMIGGDVAVGLKMWHKSLMMLLVQSEKLASNAQDVQSVFGAVALKHLKEIQDELKDPTVTREMRQRAVLMTGLADALDLVLTGFEKLIELLGGAATIIRNYWNEIKTVIKWFIAWELWAKAVTIAHSRLERGMILLLHPFRALALAIRTPVISFTILVGTVFGLIVALKTLNRYLRENVEGMSEKLDMMAKKAEPNIVALKELVDTAVAWWQKQLGLTKEVLKQFEETNVKLKDIAKEEAQELLKSIIDPTTQFLKEQWEKIKEFLGKLATPPDFEAGLADAGEGLDIATQKGRELAEVMKDLGKLTTTFGKRLKEAVKAGDIAETERLIPLAIAETEVEVKRLENRLKELGTALKTAFAAENEEAIKEIELAIKDVIEELTELSSELVTLPQAEAIANVNRWKNQFTDALRNIGLVADETSEQYEQAVRALIQGYMVLLQSLPPMATEAGQKALKSFTDLIDKTILKGKKKLTDIEKIFDVFFERIQGAFADAFYDIFTDQWEGWQDLLKKVKDLFTRTIAEMIAQAAKEEIKLQITTELAGDVTGGITGGAAGGAAGGMDWTSGGFWGAFAYIASYTIEGLIEVQEAMDERKRALRKTLKEISKYIDEALEETKGNVEEALDAINEEFDHFVRTLWSLEASATAVAKVEAQRLKVLEKTKAELLVAFLAPLKDIIAGLTMDERALELYKLGQWYDKLIGDARLLGAEATKYLREAYELQKKQYYLRVQESLLEPAERYQEIIETAGKSPLELAIREIMKAHDEALAGFAETEAEIVGLINEINANIAEAARLSSQLSSYQAAYNKAIKDYEAFLDKFVKAWLAHPDMYKLVGGSYEAARTKILSELAYYRNLMETAPTSTSAGHFWWKSWFDQLLSFSKILEAATVPELTSLPGEIQAINTAIADLRALLAELEGDLADMVALELAAFEARKQEIIDTLSEDWATVIRKNTMTEQGLALLALDKWYEEQLAAAEALGMALDDLTLAYGLQLKALEEGVTEGWAEIIRKHTLTDYELGLFELEKWYEEQLAIAEELGLAIDDLNEAYELQLQALKNLGGALDDTIKSIDKMIEELTGGALAPVQSAEYYMTKYADLLASAMKGTPGAVDELLAFIPAYLDFMKVFGGDYAGLVAAIVAALENLKITLPGLQGGGLAIGPTVIGELGKSEWVVPTYEPQRSEFLKDVGVDPVIIGKTIARELKKGGNDIHVHLEIDGHEVGYTIAGQLRSNVDLIEAVRKATKMTPGGG